MSGGRGSGRDAGTFLALAVLIVVGIGLLLLTAMVMPQVMGLIVVVLGFILFGAFHYVVWGWMFTGETRDEFDEAEDDRDRF